MANLLLAVMYSTNPKFAETLTAIQRDRGETFYKGSIAEKIVSTVKDSPVNPGLLERVDLEAYRIIERPPICTQYRDHSVCGMGPPSSGGVTVAQILGILEAFNLKMLGPNDPLTWHLFIEAGKLAFADRNLFLADPDFIDIPVEALLSNDYLRSRANLIDLNTALEVPVAAGKPIEVVNFISGHKGWTTRHKPCVYCRSLRQCRVTNDDDREWFWIGLTLNVGIPP